MGFRLWSSLQRVSKSTDTESGIPFDDSAKAELFGYLEKNYCSGLTLSGGDPLFPEEERIQRKVSKQTG